MITVNGLSMSSPQSVECHRMTGLKTVTVPLAKESRTTDGPREQSLSKRDRVRELENLREVAPDLLSEWTRVDEVTG